MRFGKDLVAAGATPLVLAVLTEGDSYGYEILRQVRERTNGSLEWKEGMLYPLLHRLEDKGLIEGYDRSAPNGRSRRYYRISASGRAELTDQRQAFSAMASFLDVMADRALGPTPNPGASHV